MRQPASLSIPAPAAVDEVAPVWVLDDPLSANSGQAIGIAERLGVPHLRVPLRWNWKAPAAALHPAGSLRGLVSGGGPPWPLSAPQGPALALSAGGRSLAVALWLRTHFGARIVHCGHPPFGLHAASFDLLVVPRPERVRKRDNVLPVLGIPHRLAPMALSQARLSWAARLAHLPRPLITLLVGDGGLGELRPAMAHALARTVAGFAVAAGGSVLAATSRRTGPLATEAVAAGLAPSMHLLYRWGEPGENPYAGFIGLADATVVTGGASLMISEACAGDAPVFIAATADALGDRNLHANLYRAGQARPLGDSLSPWPRTPLDEAGRVATEIRVRMSVGPQGID